MPDRYVFTLPINFEFEVPGGESNPDLRDQLRAECERIVHNLLRSGPQTEIFAGTINLSDCEIILKGFTGFLGTKSAPNRFRPKEIEAWHQIATELKERSVNDYGAMKHTKKNLIKKADVPYYIGRFCYYIISHISKYKFMQFRHVELLTYWADKYNTKNKPPPTPKAKKRAKKKAKPKQTARRKAWLSMSEIGSTFGG